MKKNIAKNAVLQLNNQIKLLVLVCIVFTTASAQDRTVSGTVTDSLGMPLPGVTIMIQDTNTGTNTDYDGNYTIQASPVQTLVFTYIGMRTASQLVGNQTKIDIILKEDSMLEEVIVVGYGSKKKSDVISSVVSIKAEDMTKVATSDIGEMLRGKAAGVQVTLASGAPGGSSTIRIRGQRSVDGGNDPIVIADGVRIGSINDINANDIESLEVLKDAAAQAIYGARASNGVILITTKRGKEGKLSVTYNGFSGIQNINRNFDIYSGAEFAQLKREAFRTNNGGVYRPDEEIFSALELASVQSGEYIDWEDLILRTGTTQNHAINVSAGTDKFSIFSSVNYIHTEGVIPNSDYDKVGLRLNVDQKVNSWLKVGLNTSFQFSETNNPNTNSPTGTNNSGILITSITTAPLGNAYNEDGTFRLLPGGFAENKNPLIDIYETTNLIEQRNDILNLFADVTLFKGFNYRLNASRRSWNYKRLSYNTTQSLAGIANSGQGSGAIQFQDNVEWQIENILTYKFDLKEAHHFNITAVQSISKTEYNNFTNTADRIPNDILGIYGLGGAFLNTPSISGTRRGIVSAVGRFEYDYDNKYYFTVSGRADGSTVFGKNNKWAYFPAANLGWNVYKENFLKDVDEVSNLKLRFSYGSVGNEGIQPGQSQSTADQSNYIIDGNPVTGYVPGNTLPNPDLKWETSTTFNAAIDLGFFNNRITSTIEFYNTRTKDLLVREALDPSSGYNFKWNNLGEIENEGIEVTLNGDVIRNDNFKFSVGVSYTKNNNKIISLYGKDADGDGVEDDDVANRRFIGQPIGVFYQYQPVGIFQEGEDIINSAQPLAQPGDIKLRDVNGDGVINDDDRVITSQQPDWFGTLSLNLEYKNFDMSADFYTVQGVTRNNPFLYGYSEGGSLRGIKNGIKQNYWTPENPGGDFPRPREGNDPSNIFNMGLQDASYVRLQNITMGYRLPESILKKFGLSNFRLYITGSNLFTITDFQSYSPERNPNEYPEPVTVVTGLQIGF
ncbi:TonB-linked SusC/RagA family outer membrane protein [Flavobacterium arsenatis]|uniref:TonB-linked SusC/RagA family outer membrane protein n=1 Tax=Flavobacterium arsenatis TaxID=1484332 RepID=A0ABU1TU22_9FLAO|nr:TonB-dependent receptor [Flavobacterium arsenatis]MDR6969379.1 TonB-linked SusC/RagA family outer membrane protein [Flavobacterium arsenatis]